MLTNGQILLKTQDLVKHFPIIRGIIFQKQVGAVKAVDGVSFKLEKGKTLGLVGESGCGKSTLGRVILRLHEPTSGSIIFNGKDITDLDRRSLRELRKDMQIVFQDPQASLNPRLPVGNAIAEPLEIFNVVRGKEKKNRVRELMEIVGLNPDSANRYPHEFSGGQKQRIGVARALALNPKLIVCDEPVSALDVSIQAQVVNLFQDLQKQFGLTYLFIAHDLSIVRHISDDVAVMYLGKIVEYAPSEELYSNPRHPYTEALMSAVPVPDPKMKRERILLEGDPPSPKNPPSGCRFHTRCPYVMDECRTQNPPTINFSETHWAECHLFSEDGSRKNSDSQVSA
ncbi:MAG TPA: dipeptide ABC transporter ATP-binding protein [bacterium]|jgi:oligopeptide transport system ATP-binding protein